MPYLEGTRFTTLMDYDALKWILILADATGNLARQLIGFSEMEFKVVYLTRTKHQGAELLSRLPTAGRTVIQSMAHYWSWQSVPHRKMKGKDASSAKASSATARRLKLLPSPEITCRMPNYDPKGEESHTNASRTIHRAD